MAFKELRTSSVEELMGGVGVGVELPTVDIAVRLVEESTGDIGDAGSIGAFVDALGEVGVRGSFDGEKPAWEREGGVSRL